jgi:mRNA interferase MazF
VLVVQIDRLSRSRIATVAVVILTSNLRLADVPGNVLVEPENSGLPNPSVVNVSQLISADKSFLDDEPQGLLPLDVMARVDDGLRLVLGL